MNITAEAKSVKMSPRKVRLVADAVRSLSIRQALISLDLLDKRAAGPLKKTIESAVANAVHNAQLEKDSLRIAEIIVNEGQAMKRFHPSTRGRVHPYKRRTSHIRVTLKGEKEVKSS